MNFLFNIEAGGKVGLGHYYRSISVAKKLKLSGHQIVFAFLTTEFWQKELKNNFSFDYIEIHNNYEEIILNILTNKKIDVFYFDGIKEFGIHFTNRIKKRSKLVFYQNLSQSRVHADVFIQPSDNVLNHFYSVFSNKTTLYKGLKYFVINDKINSFKAKNYENISKVKRVAIITGGADPTNALIKVFNKIDFLKFPDIKFHFFYGKDYMHLRSLPSVEEKNISFEEFLFERVYDCDLLISAFGVSTYEFLSLGIPTISFGHQMSNAKASDYMAFKYNSNISLGLIDGVSNEIINYTLLKLIQEKEIRVKLNYNATNVIDSRGSYRVAEILQNV